MGLLVFQYFVEGKGGGGSEKKSTKFSRGSNGDVAVIWTKTKLTKYY